jgi:hypothetical protein
VLRSAAAAEESKDQARDVQNVTPTGTTSLELVPRVLRLNTFHGTAVGTVQSELIDKMVKRVTLYRNKGGVSPEVVREIMMDTVRATGKLLPDYVGQDSVGVYLDTAERKVSTRFHPFNTDEQAALLRRASGVDARFLDVPTVSTPFVLVPGTIFGPSIGNPGGWTLLPSGINFEYSRFGIETQKAGSSFFTAQPRRPYR